jgi:hypothetical protein
VAPGPPERGPRRGPGATAGIVLIVVGLVFLLGQFLPGLPWWSLWPLIIVFAGIVQAVTPGRDGWNVNRLFDGLVTVTFGLVVLGVTTGYVGLGVVREVIRLWPVLVIAIGLDLLGKATRMSWIGALGSLAVIAALAYAVSVARGDVPPFRVGAPLTSANRAEISEPVGSVREGMITLDASVANVTVDGGSDLVSAQAVSPWGEPDLSVRRSGNEADVSLSLGEADGPFVWLGGPEARLDAEISREVVWDVVLNAGVSSLSADLKDVAIRNLELRPGVADCSVTLGEVPREVDEATVLVRSGVSSISLELPEDAEARLESDSGLTGHDIGGDFDSAGQGVRETPGFDRARDAGEGVWLITVRSGIGSIQVDTY